MAGFLFMRDGDQFQFHVGQPFPRVDPGFVAAIQLDCDELVRGIELWPAAWTATSTPPGSRVARWRGAGARRFVSIWQSETTTLDPFMVKDDPQYIALVLQQMDDLSRFTGDQARERIVLAIKIRREAASK